MHGMNAAGGEPHAREQGSAILAVIVMAVLFAGLIVTFSMTTSDTADGVGVVTSRLVSESTIGTASTRVAVALRTGILSEGAKFQAADADWARVPDAGLGERVEPSLDSTPMELRQVDAVRQLVANGTWAKVAALAPRTFSMPLDNDASCGGGPCPVGARRYWQIVRIELPSSTGGVQTNLAFHLRGWIGTSGRTTVPPETRRVEFRSGTFAEYQLVADEAILFGTGAIINGPVHSNGLSPILTFEGDVLDGSIRNEPGVVCKSAAIASTAEGAVVAPPAGCLVREDTETYINVGRATSAIDEILSLASSGAPEVWRDPTPPIDYAGVPRQAHAVDVWIDGNRAVVSSPAPAGPPGSWVETATVPIGWNTALAFEDDVNVRGHLVGDRRVTIAARRANGGVADIHVVGDTTHDDGAVIGLIAQGDIVVPMEHRGDTCSTTRIEAAMVAVAGGLTIPRSLQTAAWPGEGTLECPSVEIVGAIAGHRAPILRWLWLDGELGQTGFDERSYVWDPLLRTTPPPYFPLTNSYDLVSTKIVSLECQFTSTLDAGCT